MAASRVHLAAELRYKELVSAASARTRAAQKQVIQAERALKAARRIKSAARGQAEAALEAATQR